MSVRLIVDEDGCLNVGGNSEYFSISINKWMRSTLKKVRKRH
jgi:hypothetical protein